MQCYRQFPHASGAHWSILFQAPALTISDVVCRPDGGGCSHELCFDRHRIAFLRGGAYNKHIAGEVIPCDAASAIFYNKGEIFRTSHPTLEGDHDTFLDFADEILEEAIEKKGRKLSPFLFAGSHAIMNAAAILASRKLFWVIERETASPIQIEEDALRLLSRVLSVEALKSISPSAKRLANAAREAIVACPCEAISLSELARHIRSSPYHLSRVFSAVHGLSVHAYQTRVRLTLALDRLYGGEDNLTALALECGFSSHSHFSHAFRQIFGLSPSRFRSTARANVGPARPFPIST